MKLWKVFVPVIWLGVVVINSKVLPVSVAVPEFEKSFESRKVLSGLIVKVPALVRLPLRVVSSAMVNAWDAVFDISPFTVEFSKERVPRFVRFPVKVIFLRVVVPLFV